MRDLTQGAIWRHLVGMAMFIGAGLVVNTLYMLIDLYFVSRLGKQAVAGVGAAGTAMYITMAITQIVGVGSLSLISHAVGRKDQADAQLIFEQALSMGLLMAGIFLVIGYGTGGWIVSQVASDELTARDARIYLYWYLPALASMFANAPLGSALRAAGVVGIPMLIQSGTVLINAILAPVLIMGFLTGHAMGVAGAGLASSIAALFGTGGFVVMFNRAQKYMHLHSSLRPKWDVWKRITAIGLPATGEFAMIFVTTGVCYWSIRHFGPQAQAGYGIGARTMQAVFLPAMAVAFATGPIAGQNFGARNPQRVRDTFRHAAVIGGAIMLSVTLLCQISPHILVQPFSSDPAVVDVATEFLRIASWNFVAVGLTFCCSGMFQALGDTKPALLSSASRLITYVVPAIWLAGQSWASLRDFWYLSLASIIVQALIALWLLRRQLHHKLFGMTQHQAA